MGSFLWAILPKSIKNDLNTELFCGCCLVAGVLWSLEVATYLAVGNDLTDTKNYLIVMFKEFNMNI